jgi:hypothetical protein
VRSWLLATCGLAACGRLRFDPVPGGPGGDAQSPRLNRAFVTSAPFTGNLGGLGGADAKCMAAAGAGGWPGTFVAFVSTSSTNAIDRLTSSRGWMRTDDVPVIDSIGAAFTTSQMFAPIDRDEHGARVGYGGAPYVWTGSAFDGTYNSGTSCNDWTLDTGGAGEIGDFSAIGGAIAYVGAQFPCSVTYHLLCFEIGNNLSAAAPAMPITGRRIFISSPRTSAGLPALDMLCANDATAAGLPGTYLAAVATSTGSIASRFTLDGRIVQRRDGTLVANSGSFWGGLDLDAGVDQTAAGAYTGSFVFTGALDPTVTPLITDTCNDWADISAASSSRVGRVASALAAGFWTDATPVSFGTQPCSTMDPVLCVEQ